MASSIKAKIISYYLTVLLVMLIGLGLFLYISLGKIVYDSIDSSLLSRAKALATLINESDSETEFDFSDESMWDYHSPQSKSFFQIIHSNGVPVEKSASLGNLALPYRAGPRQTSFTTTNLRGQAVRVVTFYLAKERRSNNSKQESGVKVARDDLIIQCAERIQEQIKVIRDYALVLVLAILLVMLISAAGAFFITRAALKPLQAISAKVGRMSEANLSERIHLDNIPVELKVLSTSFNHTFDLLESSFNRQKQFTSDAAHELRTPLSVILSQSEITLRKERSRDEYKHALMAVKEAGKLMSALVTRLLALARLSADKTEIKKEPIDVLLIIDKAVQLLKTNSERNGIRVRVAPTRQPAIIEGDAAAILELLVNILDNAIKYNIPHGKIDICIEKKDAFLVIQIQDTGIGIDEDDLDHLFERFYRADKSRSRKIDGVGLGLSICREITRLHGGRITIQSQREKGSTVRVFLPFKSPPKPMLG